MLKNKLFSFFLVGVVVFDANYKIVSASCSTANAENECCWLVRYEGLVKSINDRPGFQAPITEAFQESHFGRSEGALGLHLAHVMSWSDIRCRLDKLFQEAYLVEQNSTEANTNNYDAIRDFLKKLFEIDGDAVVNHGGWYPPLTLDGWNAPDAKWFEQTPIVRPFRNVAPVEGNPKCNSLTWTSYDSGCCTEDEPCGVGEGDCDKDADCKGGLSCGENNCDTDGTGFTSQADCCYLNNSNDYLTEKLVGLGEEYLKEALYYLDETNRENKVDFWKESHEDDYFLTQKEENGKSIREIFELANAATTNLRYGDGSSNSAIQENFDPMGDERGVMTVKETEMMQTYVITPKVEEFNGHYYIRSSTGKHQPDSTYKNRWYIKCLQNNEKCF